MWVSPDVRGLGLGRRLLRELEDLARDHGATAAHLETNRALTEAIALYRASGYERSRRSTTSRTRTTGSRSHTETRHELMEKALFPGLFR